MTLSVEFSLPNYIKTNSNKLEAYGFTIYYPGGEDEKIRVPFKGLAKLTTNISHLQLGLHKLHTFVVYPVGKEALEVNNQSITRRMSYIIIHFVL